MSVTAADKPWQCFGCHTRLRESDATCPKCGDPVRRTVHHFSAHGDEHVRPGDELSYRWQMINCAACRKR